MYSFTDSSDCGTIIKKCATAGRCRHIKRIAFFQDNLDVGGIQKSIINLLKNFDYAHYEVDLYLSDAKRFWDVDFPPELHIKYLRPLPHFYSFMPFDMAKKLVSLDFSDVKEPYDVAIDFNSYQFSCALGALTVPAKRRVMWIHNNVSVKLENEWKYRVLWHNFKDKFKYYDEFIGVSQGVIEPFKECSGMYDKRFTVIQNTIDTREIYAGAAEETDFTVDPDKLNLVAIGRLCHQKGYDIMLEEMSRLIQLRDDVHLYIIGDGDKRLMLEYQRDSLGLTDYVTFLGQKKNPFVYMDKMDAFVSTSRYEGQPLNVMEARALGLPLYCTKNLEIYSEGLEGCEDIVTALASAQKTARQRDDLHEYNQEIIRRVSRLADEPPVDKSAQKKQVNIIALHLGTGGVEKAIISMANLFAERYDVRLYSVYKVPGSPSLPVDSRVSVRYLLRDVPNREEWRAAIRARDLRAFWRESMRSLRILTGKRSAVRKIIRNVTEGVIITTRHEDNLPLSRYGAKQVLKIGQLHHDHNFKRKYLRAFRRGYRNLDVLALLTPQLVEEAAAVMKGHNSHTKLVYMPNFLERYPETVSFESREKMLLAVGRVTGVKRFDLLTEQFVSLHSRAPDWKLRVIGDGEDLGRIRRYVQEHDAGSYIELPGQMDNAAVQKEMLKASLFAMSSSSEGFPFVLLEAQSCGLPIVAYDVRVGPGFLVRDGQTGYLVPEGERGQYEDRLVQLMDDEAARKRMGETAVQHAAAFTRDNIAEKWFTVIG